jgi:uracil-DNA glycosylase
MNMLGEIAQSWQAVVLPQMQLPYFDAIIKQLQTDENNGKTIYPAKQDVFNAFTYCNWNDVKIVILGQDPYHGAGEAHGLAFSVPTGVKIPPSLKNIYKELQADVNLPLATTGNLQSWAKQGVLLINASLTVIANTPNSHAAIGWHTFTDAIIQQISAQKSGIIFMLWGKFAQQKTSLIDTNKHTILQAPHPSPFSAHTGFLGCKHFSKANQLLVQQNKTAIDWQIASSINNNELNL